MNTREIAEGTIRQIREHGWSKGSATGPDDEMCMAIAMNHAQLEKQPFSNADSMQATDETLAVIDDLFPGRSTIEYPSGKLHDIPMFNDHPDTTVEDVLLVLKHLAEQ